jgi:hypothetical protein
MTAAAAAAVRAFVLQVGMMDDACRAPPAARAASIIYRDELLHVRTQSGQCSARLASACCSG